MVFNGILTFAPLIGMLPAKAIQYRIGGRMRHLNLFNFLRALLTNCRFALIPGL
jgi:hypothetical protein